MKFQLKDALSGRWRPWVLGLAVVIGGAWLFGLRTLSAQSSQVRRGAAGTAAARAVPVVGAPARTADFPVYLTGLGTVIPVNTVTVRTRVDGQIIDIAYREGQFVREGDLLAEIDPRPFQVLLHQAEGQLAKDQAALANAKVDLKRYQELIKDDSISRQQLDTQATVVDQYEAATKSDQAQVDSARLSLTYSRITAPIPGIVGLRLVDLGNIVHASDPTGLLVITQQQPITAVFTLVASSLSKILPPLRAGTKLAVEAWDTDLTHKLADGSVLAWGQNTFGQCTVPAAASNVVAIAGGLEHSLALRADGSAVAWGNNSNGQGAVPAGLSNGVAVAAGFYHNVLLLGSGSPCMAR
jgi:multidrug efflux system membrane fusion protein